MARRRNARRSRPEPVLFEPSSILYMDNHLLVINKPAGMLVQGDVSGDMDLLTAGKAYLKEKFKKPGNVFLGLVHRLDRPVSGVMVFARTSKAASRLGQQFRKRSVVKRYLAMVEGKLPDRGQLVDYLRKDHKKVRLVREDHPNGLRAELSFEVLNRKKGRAIVLVNLATGRPHQIRVQLANQGAPIVGDFKYGSKTPLDGWNLALHSKHLEIDHPTQNVRMKWEAPVPSTWASWVSGIPVH